MKLKSVATRQKLVPGKPARLAAAVLFAAVAAMGSAQGPAPATARPRVQSQLISGRVTAISGSTLTLTSTPALVLQTSHRSATAPPVQLAVGPGTRLLATGNRHIALKDIHRGDTLLASAYKDANSDTFHSTALVLLSSPQSNRTVHAVSSDPRDADLSPVNPAIP